MGDLHGWLINFSWMMVVVTFAFMVLDFIAGVIKGAKEKNLKSSIMWIGLFKKMGYIIVICLACLIEIGCLFLPLPFDVPMVSVVCCFIIICETISIIENAKTINPNLDNVKFFSIFGNKNDTDNDWFGDLK